MKRIILTIFAVFLLSACGGGGAAPDLSASQQPVRETVTEEQRIKIQARAEVEELQKSLGNTPAERELKAKLSKVKLDLDDARRAIGELLAEIKQLRADINTLKVAALPNCGTNEEVRGGVCECVAGYTRQNRVCELPPPNCGTNEEPNGRSCECITGYVRQQNGMCELPPPNCGTNEEADGQRCICKTGYERINGNCVVPPNCGANEKPTLGLGTSPYCICVEGYRRQNGVCELPPPNCGMNEKPNGRNCECVSGYVRQGNICVDKTSLPCTDFRVRDSAGECTYNTPEFREFYPLDLIGAEHAYNSGYFGEGVTIHVRDEVMRSTHVDLSANVASISTTIDENKPLPFREDLNGHGTAVAGIIAAVRDGKGVHGVAPQAKVYQVAKRFSPHFREFVAKNNIRIENISIGSGDIADFGGLEGFKADSKNISDANKNADRYLGLDLVRVSSAGNSRWNSGFIRANLWNYYPHIRPELEKHWIVVGALDSDNEVRAASNGCGDTKMYCIFSYGGTVRVLDDDSNTDYRPSRSGTSFSAPIVSGALAVLQSAAHELPMTVIRHILLQTATPMGSRITTGMPDELYGWGRVNISAGIVSIEALETEGMNGKSGILLADLRESLPGEFAHLRGHLSDVSVALRITDRSYYNMRLSDIVGGGDSDFHRNGNMGRAAEEMQADSYKAGEAFHFWGGLDYDGGKSNYIGEGGGIFSAASAEDIGGYMRWTTANYGGISAFGEYGRTAIKADYGGNPLIAAVDNARAEEWTMGIQYRDLWRKDDNIILSARQESRISGGNMILHYPVADGDSHKAFIGETPQTIRTETTKIPIKQKPQTIWTLGYSQKTDNGKWSAATEWNTAKNKSAFSAAIVINL